MNGLTWVAVRGFSLGLTLGAFLASCQTSSAGDRDDAAAAIAIAKARSCLCAPCDCVVCECGAKETPVSGPQVVASAPAENKPSALVHTYAAGHAAALVSGKLCVIGVGVEPPTSGGWVSVKAEESDIPKFAGKVILTVPAGQTLYKVAELNTAATDADVHKALTDAVAKLAVALIDAQAKSAAVAVQPAYQTQFGSQFGSGQFFGSSGGCANGQCGGGSMFGGGMMMGGGSCAGGRCK